MAESIKKKTTKEKPCKKLLELIRAGMAKPSQIEVIQCPQRTAEEECFELDLKSIKGLECCPPLEFGALRVTNLESDSALAMPALE